MPLPAPRSPPVLLLALLLVPALAAPAATADHLDGMTVTQRGIGPDHLVSLRVTYRVTGECCGGIFAWTTGDGASGALPDGVTDGVYDGDARGPSYLSDGRLVQWERTRDPAGVVELLVWYHYKRTGLFTLAWSGCCPDHGGTLSVVAV